MNVERVEALLRLLQDAGAAEMVVEADGWRLGARKGPAPVAPQSAEAAPPPAGAEPVPELPPHPVPITATLVGIYRNDEPPIMEGDSVSAGQPVGGIESMGILNPVLAPASGEVIRVAVRDGQGVEYGQELMALIGAPDPEAA